LQPGICFQYTSFWAKFTIVWLRRKKFCPAGALRKLRASGMAGGQRNAVLK